MKGVYVSLSLSLFLSLSHEMRSCHTQTLLRDDDRLRKKKKKKCKSGGDTNGILKSGGEMSPLSPVEITPMGPTDFPLSLEIRRLAIHTLRYVVC